MWLRRNDYDALVHELTEQRTKREAAEKALALQTQTVDWLKVQVNTLQFERASLLAKVTGAPVMVPTIRDSTPMTPSVEQTKEPPQQFFNQLAALFEDPGDDVAGKLGIAHDDAGGVIYTQ